MPALIALLLVAGVAVSQLLHGGLIFPALAWPGALCVLTAGLLSAACAFRTLREGPLPGLRAFAVLGLSVALAAYALWRWFAVGTPSAGFLVVNNLIVGSVAIGAVLFGLPSPGSRLVLVGGLLLVALGQFFLMLSFRLPGGGLEFPWFSEVLREWYQERLQRSASGTFLNRNHLSWSLNAGVLFSLSLCLWARIPAFLKFLCGWCAGLLTLGVLWTFSRGGIVGLCAGGAVFALVSLFFLFTSRVKHRIALILLTVAVLVGVSGAAYHLISSDYRVQGRIERLGADPFREVLWQAGLRQAQAAPLLGTGPGTSGDYARILRPPRMDASDAVYHHNDWLQLLADGGWVGLSLGVLLLLAAFSCAWHGVFVVAGRRLEGRIPQSSQLALQVAALSLLAAFASQAFFDFNLQLAANSLLAFLVLGIAAGGMDFSNTDSRMVRVFGGACALACAGIAVGWLLGSRPVFQDHYEAMQIRNEIRRGGFALALERVERGPAATFGNSEFYMAAGDVWLALQADANAAGREFLAKRYRTKSAWNYSRAVRAEQTERFSRLRLATLQSLRGEHGASVGLALDAVRLDPHSALPYEYLAAVMEEAGDYGQAARWYWVSSVVPGGTPFARWRSAVLAERRKAGEISRTTGPAIPAFLQPEKTENPTFN